MTARLFLKLIAGIICLLGVALLCVDLFATRVAESTFTHNLVRELADKGRMVGVMMESGVRPSGTEFALLGKSVGARLTMISRDGRVVADSESNPTGMDNHLNRPELSEALHGRQGSSVRRSSTLGVNFLYVAVPVGSGALRMAVPLSEVERQSQEIRRKILGSTALAFLPAILLAALLARYLSHRFADIIHFAGELAAGNLKARIRRVDRGEFGQLARRLNETGENFQRTVEQLQSEHSELEKLERVRKDFVINVSHELRTPLASIQGYTETLMDGAIEDPQNNMRFLGIIRHNAERLARLTEDLLTLSRVEMRHQDFRFDQYQANELLSEAVEMVKPMVRKKNLELRLEPAADNAPVYCDAEATSHILINLLDNAIKYTPAGGRITVGAQAGPDQVEFFVRDSGIGIPEEDQPRLFERFYRVDKARSRALGGTGLGLSIVKHLVLAQNGRVRVESRLNEGSTFFFALPARSGEAERVETLNAQFTAS